MDQTTVDQILERLDSLGEISIQGFEILARQAFYEGIKYLIWALIWLAIFVIVVKIAQKTFKGELFEDVYTFDGSFNGRRSYHKQWALIYGLASIPALLATFYHVTHGILRLINPEFYAIRYILNYL